MSHGYHFRDFCLKQTQRYVEGVLERVYPPFMNIDKEAEKAANDFLEAAMERPVNENWSDDPSSYAEAAQEHGIEVYMGLDFLRREVTNSATAGLYHLWEKLLKAWLSHPTTWSARVNFDKKELSLATGPDLIKELRDIGVAISTDVSEELETLRFVANVSKHARGTSFTKLRNREEDLFGMSGNIVKEHGGSLSDFGADVLVQPDDLEVTAERFEKFGLAAQRFWEEMPDYLDLRAKA